MKIITVSCLECGHVFEFMDGDEDICSKCGCEDSRYIDEYEVDEKKPKVSKDELLEIIKRKR